MYISTFYYNLKQSNYSYRQSINIYTEKIRLGFHVNLLCPFGSWVGFRFIASPHLNILSVFFQYATGILLFMFIPVSVVLEKGGNLGGGGFLGGRGKAKT